MEAEAPAAVAHPYRRPTSSFPHHSQGVIGAATGRLLATTAQVGLVNNKEMETRKSTARISMIRK